MNFENQLKIIRQQKHNEYVDYINKIEIQEQIDLNKQKKIAIMANLSSKYKHIFNPNPIEKAVWTIQKFIQKYYFQPKCINENEMMNIPVLYRIRITFTKNHIPKSSTLQNTELTKRKKSDSIIPNPKRIAFMFRYCFDIRDLYPVRNSVINLENKKYILLSKDCIRVESLWNKINGSTSESIRYLNSLEYYKSLSHDKKFGYDMINQDENINRIKKILENNDENHEDIFIININGVKIDLMILDKLNKKYFNLN